MTEYGTLILCNGGCAIPVPTKVLDMAWDVTREAHGVESGAIMSNQQSLYREGVLE